MKNVSMFFLIMNEILISSFTQKKIFITDRFQNLEPNQRNEFHRTHFFQALDKIYKYNIEIK